MLRADFLAHMAKICYLRDLEELANFHLHFTRRTRSVEAVLLSPILGYILWGLQIVGNSDLGVIYMS